MTIKPSASALTSHHSDVAQSLLKIQQELIDKNKFFEALQALMLLAKDNFQDAQLWLVTGMVYCRIAYWQHAIGSLETALQLEPKNKQAKQLLSLALFSIGKKEEGCKLIDEVVRYGDANSAQWMLRAYLHAHTNSDPMHALSTARDWGKRFADPLTRSAKPLIVRDRDLNKKLKIGYVTADFREHSVAFFMQPVLAHHDSQKVLVHVYSNGPSDHVTMDLKELTPKWFDVQTMTDEELLSKIRNDEIDVLVDLSGFTHGHRLGVFARRAAPVQVTWLGYKPTLGMKAMDYRLFNKNADNYQKFYYEKLVKLKCPTSYMPPEYSPMCEIPPAVNNGYITFGSLNNSSKITDATLKVWAQILQKINNAKLIIYVKEDSLDSAEEHMLPRLIAAQMPLDRVSVIAQQSLRNFMETGFIADVMLDTFPVCGGTTVLHSIWMGMPVICMDGQNDVEKSSANTINGLAFGGLVAATHEEYIENAIKVASNIRYIEDFRKRSRVVLKKSNLMNYKDRAAELEYSFQKMWVNYLKSK